MASWARSVRAATGAGSEVLSGAGGWAKERAASGRAAAEVARNWRREGIVFVIVAFRDIQERLSKAKWGWGGLRGLMAAMMQGRGGER